MIQWLLNIEYDVATTATTIADTTITTATTTTTAAFLSMQLHYSSLCVNVIADCVKQGRLSDRLLTLPQ